MRTRMMTTIPVIAALLASSAATNSPVLAQSSRDAGQGYCRNPAQLPNLGIERDNERSQQYDGRPGSVLRGVTGERSRDYPPSVSPPPPPPPPAPAAPSIDSGSDVVVTARRVESAEYASPVDAAPDSATVPGDGEAPSARGSAEGRIVGRPVPPRPRPRPQAGLLTAGEHDDLLNPELYARYLARSDLPQVIPDIPVLDTSRLLTVEVRDNNGRPVPFADIVLTCSDGNSITLASQADGRAVFFPQLDRLSPSVQVRVRRAGTWQGPARTIALSAAPGGQQVGVTIGASASAVSKLDLMLVVDTTGSMGDEIRYLQSELRSIVSEIGRRHAGMDIRIGFVFYRDTGDDYVTRTVSFDRDLTRVDAVLARQAADGGGDYPEAMDQALIRAMNQSWRPDAIKTMMLVADAPPHDAMFARSWAAAEVARRQRIHIVPVAASGVADRAEYVMRGMAALTQSRYLFLTDDSGIGNPHAPPAVDCYLVTRLDALIRRVIASQISGRRVEPNEGEIIRSVGQYDNGRCILPQDFGKAEPLQ